LFIQKFVSENIKIICYTRGSIEITIEYEKDGKKVKHIIKTSRESIDKIIDILYMPLKSFIEKYEIIPNIIPPTIVIALLKSYNVNASSLEELYCVTALINKLVIAKIIEEMTKPATEIEEENMLEYLFNEILNHKYIFEWEKRREVIKALDIDPNEIIFVDENFVYVPRKFVSTRIKSSPRPKKDLEDALGMKLKIFDTSYSKEGFKINVVYILIPRKLIEEEIGKKITPPSFC
jgi:hypothetical protein